MFVILISFEAVYAFNEAKSTAPPAILVTPVVKCDEPVSNVTVAEPVCAPPLKPKPASTSVISPEPASMICAST